MSAVERHKDLRWRGRQLRQRNVELEAVVAARTGELRGREAELVRARDEADRANHAKSAFLANMSHELRTPLDAVLGHAQLLLKQPNLPADSRERVAIIGQSGGHLLSLVNQVLDSSKVEAGKLTLSPFDFSLPGLLGETVAVFRPRFSEKGLALESEHEPRPNRFVHQTSPFFDAENVPSPQIKSSQCRIWTARRPWIIWVKRPRRTHPASPRGVPPS